jgi:hypothetical protein
VNANKAKGDRFQRDFAVYLNEHGLLATHRPGWDPTLPVVHTDTDRGDVVVYDLPDVLLQLKDTGREGHASYFDDAKKQAANANADWPFVVEKRRRGKGSTGRIEDAWVRTDARTWVAVMCRLLELERDRAGRAA